MKTMSTEPIQILDIFSKLNPKPPYECKSIRTNPDLIKLREKEPPLFQDEYEVYILKSGQQVFTREVEQDGYFDWYEGEQPNTELDIISQEEWNKLPKRSSGKLAKFKKEIEKYVWESRGNGIHHYHPWHERSSYFGADMLEKIPVPELVINLPQ